MPIVPTDIPMTSALLESTAQALSQRYPIALETIGHTPLGRPILALTLGTGPLRKLYTAAHHANEWITAPILLRFAEDLSAAAETGTPLLGYDAGALLAQNRLYLVPMVNPDGVDLVTGALTPTPEILALGANYPAIPFPEGWKANALGVDLNLQYPAGWLEARQIKFSQGYTRPGPRDYVGRAPLNQPESRALAEYTMTVDPALVLAYHTQGEEIYWQFRDIFIPGARELGEKLAQASGYALADTPYNSSFAGYKDWFIQEFRRPGYTVEAGKGENPLPITDFPEIYRANLPLLLTATHHRNSLS